MSDWQIFKGTKEPHSIKKWPEPPPWRNFNQQKPQKPPHETFQANDKVINAVNMAIYLRRPLLVTGEPGTGKSSLARAIASELELGDILHWPINTRSTLQEGLYYYDAIARLQDVQLNQEPAPEGKFDIGDYIRLGPLGTAMCSQKQPRVLLIDEIDKSDIDLPNDLLNIFEEGYFIIEELRRLKKYLKYHTVTVQSDDDSTYKVVDGKIICQHFPIIIMTSNGEREFPLPFKRRCIQLEIKRPTLEELTNIVKAHLGDDLTKDIEKTIKEFRDKRDKQQGTLATDQLLNVVFMFLNNPNLDDEEKQAIKERLMAYLNTTGDK
ncbi:MoxR family ATPase [Crocosphaera sp.]|uniref:AAA family ATPase n=1 Tax=Crocosphaera sp. TaxID=2729996 RepID=UPI00260615EA|nr:MoxR family ATPase [Crocosphaera sp.]MDJ0583161.1 MoxR family ATPase [Crocosphaera sp.]